MAAPQEPGELAPSAVNADDGADDISRIPTFHDFSVGEDLAEPRQGNVYGRMDLTNDGLKTQASITREFYICYFRLSSYISLQSLTGLPQSMDGLTLTSTSLRRIYGQYLNCRLSARTQDRRHSKLQSPLP